VSGERESPEPITLSPEEYFRVIEERRRAAEGVLWQLPGISLAAQAFLLSAGLSADAKSSSQLVVGALGIAAVFGTGLFVYYQTVRATTFGRWLRQAVGRPLGPDELETELKVKPRKVFSVKFAFPAFCVVCGVALLALLAADVYVFGLGAGWW
jgi:hypothetical protein